MMRRALRTALVAFAGMSFGAVPAAGADGGLVLPYANGEEGIAAPGGGHRYVVLTGSEQTTVARVAIGTGRVTASTVLDGYFAVPGVAFDQTPGGLSADGT